MTWAQIMGKSPPRALTSIKNKFGIAKIFFMGWRDSPGRGRTMMAIHGPWKIFYF